MSDSNEAARETFQKLAVFEIDPKGFLAANADSQNARSLLQAADLVDEIFWRQVLPDIDYRILLEQIGDDDQLREMFLFHHGPYDRLNSGSPFLPVEPKLPGAGFYPPDLTREEFSKYFEDNPVDKPALQSPYTVISRGKSHLAAIPYHLAYPELVNQLSELIGKASATEPHPGFREFLEMRAKDVLTDQYYASESAWVQLENNPIDLVIGPYEVYEDQLMGLKAAYEAILFERDFEESSRIKHIQGELRSLCELVESELGAPLHVENTHIKLSVANLIYAGGDARKAVPAIAFSLPNDERVVEEVGSRQVILKNVLRAKFRFVAQEISDRLLARPLTDEESAFRDFFNHTLFHEISHSIGPKRILVDGEETTVNRCLKQYFSVLEEAKADALGVCLALNAVQDLDSTLFLTGYVGRFIRAIRFGLAQSHGGANAIQFNYLFQQGAFTVDSGTNKLSIDPSRVRDSVFKLASEIISLQERGDFRAAQRFVANFCVISSEIRELSDAVKDLPIDIRIRYRDWHS
jgi:hypothetical protein